MNVDVDFEVQQRSDGTVRVRTHGMGRRGRPEIELTNISPAQVDSATDLLGRVAATISERPVYPGQMMVVSDDLSVELQEAEHMPAGFLARAFGASDRTVMRISDAGYATANGILCGTARLRAKELSDLGDQTGAARILQDALEATRDDDEAATGERALAAVQLSYIVSDEIRALDLLLHGLRLSEAAQQRTLFATFDQIRTLKAVALQTEMHQIATINLGLVSTHDMIDNTVRVVPSPLWQPSKDDPPRAELDMTMIPGPWLRLYWIGPTRLELESGLIPGLAADIFTALCETEHGIARMAMVVRETERTFPIADDAPRAAASPKLAPPHMFLASRVLAHVARLRTAELTPAEIMAAFGLDHDRERVEIARDKGRRLRVRLAQWTRDGRAGRVTD